MEDNAIQFIDLAKTGRHQWWTFLLGWGLIVTAPAILYELGELTLRQALARSVIFSEIFWYIYRFTHDLDLSTLLMLVFVFLVVRVLHRRPILSVLTANNRLNWKRFAQGFSLYLLFLLIAATVTEYIFADPEFRFGIRLPDVSARGAVMLFGSIMISATAEEVFYRGYILQALAVLTKNRLLLALACGVLFMSAHSGLDRPGATSFLLACFEIGFYLTLLTLKDNGLELAIGLHIAHNVAGKLTPYHAASEPFYFIILFPICAVIIYLILFHRSRVAHLETEEAKDVVRSFHADRTSHIP